MKICIFTVLYLYVLSVYALSPSKIDMQRSWMMDNWESIETTVSQSKSYELIPVLSTLSDLWYRRDGAMTGEISGFLIKALIYHPDLMLPMLVEKKDSFNRWLSAFNGIVFTDYAGNQFHELKQLHKEFTEAMTEYHKTCSDELKPYVQKILDQLKVTKVRVVD